MTTYWREGRSVCRP